eukprot:m.53498 g.53498  ORF g.53498 m.53498 type:complete len:283 (-) comp7461_c0_seq4:746-1594(-)
MNAHAVSGPQPPTQRKSSMLGKIGAVIKSSPKAVRRVLGKKPKGGANQQHGGLNASSSDNWLYKDEHVESGITYKVQYLGSVEVDFDQANPDANQANAEAAMRALRDHSKAKKEKLPFMGLQIAMKHMVLRSDYIGGHNRGTMVMRQSTTRVAYSTVDSARPKTFSYVAVVKGTKMALCHVFNCRSRKQGYEMTFVCAQAFALNLRYWKENKDRATVEAQQSEESDIRTSFALVVDDCTIDTLPPSGLLHRIVTKWWLYPFFNPSIRQSLCLVGHCFLCLSA